MYYVCIVKCSHSALTKETEKCCPSATSFDVPSIPSTVSFSKESRCESEAPRRRSCDVLD